MKMKLETTYRNAVRNMRPSVAEMARRNAPAVERAERAKAEIAARIAAGGNAQTIYMELSESRGTADSEYEVALRVAALGFARRARK